MKILSLWQPYAAAISWGWKQIETRSWSTEYRGAIAIHAAKRGKTTEAAAGILTKLLVQADKGVPGVWPGYGFAFGAIVATAELALIGSTDDALKRIDPVERVLGDYRPGRYAWTLWRVQLVNPVPYRGAQGLRDLPEAVASSLRPFST